MWEINVGGKNYLNPKYIYTN